MHTMLMFVPHTASMTAVMTIAGEAGRCQHHDRKQDQDQCFGIAHGASVQPSPVLPVEVNRQPATGINSVKAGGLSLWFSAGAPKRGIELRRLQETADDAALLLRKTLLKCR